MPIPGVPTGPVAAVLVWWVEGVHKFAWLVIAGAVLLTGVSGWYTVRHLGMNTDTQALISQRLDYWKTFRAFQEAFPQLRDNIVVLVEGDSPDRAEDAANALVAKLHHDDKLFEDIFFPGGDPFFRQEGLLFLETKELENLSDRLAQAQPLLGTLVADPSLRGFFDVLGKAAEGIERGDVDSGLLVRPLTMIGDTIETRLAGKDARLSWRDLMTGLPDRPSDRRQVILLKPRVDWNGFEPAHQAITTVRTAVASLPPNLAQGVRVRLTGGPAMDEDDLASVKRGAGLASVISFVLVSVIVFLGLRSPRLVLATVSTLFLSLVWTAGFATLSIGYLNLISVAFAVLFIGLAVDFSIQFGLRYKESVDQGADLATALKNAAANTGVAVSLAAFCASIGFFAFVPTSYAGLSQLGIIAGAGMFIGLFATLTLLPALLTVMPLRVSRRSVEAGGSHLFASFLARHFRAVCWGALALGLASLAAFPYARFDIDPINLKDPNSESVQAYMDVTRDSDTSPYSINILMPNLHEADAIAKRLEKLHETKSTVTLSSFVPQHQKTKLALIDEMATFLPMFEGSQPKALPSDAERRQAAMRLQTKLEALAASARAQSVAEPARRLAGLLGRFAAGPGHDPAAYRELEVALLAHLPGRLTSLSEALNARPVTLETLPANLKALYVTPAGQARVEVFPAERLTDEDALHRFVDAVRVIAPNATDTPVLLLEGSKVVIGAFEQAGVITFIAIGFLLAILLRSFWDSLLVLLPLAFAAVLAVAIVVVTGMSLNFANIIALPLLFSLGVAFGIYLVLRHRETHRVTDLLRTSTPRAVLFSALTTMVSFSSLMVSSHRGMASMGYLLGLCLTLALVCTLIVLPALLTWRERRGRARWRYGQASEGAHTRVDLARAVPPPGPMN